MNYGETTSEIQSLKMHITGIDHHEIKQKLIQNVHLSRPRSFDFNNTNQIKLILEKTKNKIKICYSFMVTISL